MHTDQGQYKLGRSGGRRSAHPSRDSSMENISKSTPKSSADSASSTEHRALEYELETIFAGRSTGSHPRWLGSLRGARFQLYHTLVSPTTRRYVFPHDDRRTHKPITFWYISTLKWGFCYQFPSSIMASTKIILQLSSHIELAHRSVLVLKAQCQHRSTVTSYRM